MGVFGRPRATELGGLWSSGTGFPRCGGQAGARGCEDWAPAGVAFLGSTKSFTALRLPLRLSHLRHHLPVRTSISNSSEHLPKMRCRSTTTENSGRTTCRWRRCAALHASTRRSVLWHVRWHPGLLTSLSAHRSKLIGGAAEKSFGGHGGVIGQAVVELAESLRLAAPTNRPTCSCLLMSLPEALTCGHANRSAAVGGSPLASLLTDAEGVEVWGHAKA